MKRTPIVLALLLLAPLAYAAGAEVKPVACPASLAVQQSELSPTEGEFFKATEPNGTINPHAVLARLHGAAAALVVALDSEKPDAKAPDVVRLDFGLKAQFAGAPAVPLKAGGTEQDWFQASIGPTTVEVKRDGKTIPVCVQGMYQKRQDFRWMTLEVSTALEGRLAFGAKTHAVRVVNCNGALTFGAKAKVERLGKAICGIDAGDTVAVDTGDGSFTSKVTKNYYGHPLLVDGAWYDVSLSPDGTKLTATPSAAATAMLKIDHESWLLTLAGDKYILALDGSNQPVAIPADCYTVAGFRQVGPLGRRGEKDAGSGLLMSGATELSRGKGKTFEAAAGKTVELAIGDPLTASITTSVRRPSARMSFSLVDAAGLRADLVLPDVGTPTPEVEVLDAAGKRVHEGKFEFG
jgi:hypothetical protein